MKLTKPWIIGFVIFAVVVVIIVVVLVVLFLTLGGDFDLRLSPPSNATLGHFAQAAVSTDAIGCAEIASDLMARGGSVADAAIGGLLCMGVVNPHALGIGGGFLLVLYNGTTRETKVLNAREVAPLSATDDMYQAVPAQSILGGRAVAVPGEIKGYWKLHQEHGRLPWAQVLQPTIDLCRKGIPVTISLVEAFKFASDDILNSTTLSEIFVNPTTGVFYAEGELMNRSVLATTLETLAVNGGDYLYQNTSLANGLIADIRRFGGNMTLEDLLRYEANWSTPIDLPIFPNLRLKTVPPPGSGALLGFMFQVLGNHLPRPTSLSQYALVYQRIIETFKYTFAQRSALGDPADPEVTLAVNRVVEQLTSPTLAATIRSRLLDSSTNLNPEYYGATFDALRDDHGTSHLSVIGPTGDAIAVTSTINLFFGCKRRSPSTGIILNNEMDDFSSRFINFFGLPPAPNNRIRPGKRPMSSMSPAIFVDSQGRPRLVVGAAGGPKIISVVALVAMRNLWFGMNVKEAMDESRIHHQLRPMELGSEPEFNPEILNTLKSFGHNLTTYPLFFSIVSAVEGLENGSLRASYDYRRGGSVGGF